MPGPPAVFLDRDGTLNVEVDYLSDPDQLVLIPGAAEALRRFRAAGYLLCVVTNQSGIARGRFDEETLHRIHERFQALLAAEGAGVDSIGYCPHLLPEEAGPTDHQAYVRPCPCRKPAPGLLEDAAQRFDIDLSRSFMIGDSLRDLDAGAALGVRGILVRTGKGAAEEHRAKQQDRAIEVEDDLAQACDRILPRTG